MEGVSQNLAGSTLHLLALLADWMISLVEFLHISKTLPTTSQKIHLHFNETALRCLFPDMATLLARNLSSSCGGLIGNCEKQNVTVQFKST
jgi:hypothetical protein